MRAIAGRRIAPVARGVVVLGLMIAGTLSASADLLTLMFFGTVGVVGAFLALRRPRNAIGWLLIALAFGFSATTTNPADLDIEALLRGQGSTRDTAVIWLSSWGGWATFVGFVALTIIFPSGRVPQARGRRPAIALLAIGAAAVVLTAIAPTIGVAPDGINTINLPNPVAVGPDLPLWTALPLVEALPVAIIAVLVIAVVRMVLRYRGATGTERLQLRWLVAAVAFVAISLVFGLVAIGIFGEAIAGAGWILVIIAYPTIPLSIGVSVMRYRLFEIDRIISRTLGWAVVTGSVGGVLALGLVALQATLADVTQGQTLAVAASTLAAFALFQPIRRRVQSAVDRRFDRARYDRELTVAAFGSRLRGRVELTAIAGDVLATVAAVVRPSSEGVWLRRPGTGAAR